MLSNQIPIAPTETLSGEFRVNFYHGSYMFLEPIVRTCANSEEFHTLRKLVEDELNMRKSEYTGGGNDCFWASFGKLIGEGRYEESLELSKLRVKL